MVRFQSRLDREGALERFERLYLDRAKPGIYAVRSSSETVYILDRRQGSLIMRSTGPSTRSEGWWDNAWVPLISVESMEGVGVVVVGSRARWLADPGGDRDPDAHWWLSRVVTSIELWTPGDLEAFLAARAG